MIRKRILSVFMICVMVISLTACGQKDKAVTTLIMADVQTGDHPTAQSCDKFAELVKEKTKGRIVIEVYHGDKLGTEAEQIAQVSVGGIDFVRVSSPVSKYYDEIKAFQALYLYSSDEAMWKVLDGDFGTKMLKSDELKKNGIEGLCWLSGGTRNFYNKVKPVTVPEDLAGMKIRVNTDSMFAFLDKCGATGLNIAYNDIYNSLESGVIDGAENNWPSYISTQHYKAAPYITVDEHTRIPEMIAVSTKTMESLSEQDQNIIRECAKEAGLYQRELMYEFEQKAIKTAEEAGCTITYLTAEQSAKFQQLADPINEKVSQKYMTTINNIKQLQK